MIDVASRDRVRFGHILDSAATIQDYAKGGIDRFLSNAMAQDAVMRRFTIVGEATKHLSPAFRRTHPEVPWSDLARFRDYLMHSYDSVIPSRVWEVIVGPLRKAQRALEEIKRKLGW